MFSRGRALSGWTTRLARMYARFTRAGSTRSVSPGGFQPESGHSTVCSVDSSARMLPARPACAQQACQLLGCVVAPLQPNGGSTVCSVDSSVRMLPVRPACAKQTCSLTPDALMLLLQNLRETGFVSFDEMR